MALRILLLLSVYDRAVNIDRMISSDFIATYGDNEYSFGELSVRRNTTFQSIRYLVTQGLILAVDSDEGFSYRITEEGREIIGQLRSAYAVRYQRVMRRLILRWDSWPDKELRDLIDIRSRQKEIQAKE